MNTQPIKLLATTLLAGSLLLTSCSIIGFSFGGKPLFGSGVSMTESRPVNDVSSVSSYGSGNLIVEHGETEALTITADDNILPLSHLRCERRTSEPGHEAQHVDYVPERRRVPVDSQETGRR